MAGLPFDKIAPKIELQSRASGTAQRQSGFHLQHVQEHGFLNGLITICEVQQFLVSVANLYIQEQKLGHKVVRKYFVQTVLRKKMQLSSVNSRNKCFIFSTFAFLSHSVSVLIIIVQTKIVCFSPTTVLSIKKIDD